jgi:GT2 family glycosyltransferase
VTDIAESERLSVLRFLTGQGLELCCGWQKYRPESVAMDTVPKGQPTVPWGHLSVADEVADAMAVPRGDGTQDYVVVSHGIEHMADPAAALREWLRVLKPGGWLCLIVPDKRFAQHDPTHRHNWEPTEFLAFLTEQGLSPCQFDTLQNAWSFDAVLRKPVAFRPPIPKLSIVVPVYNHRPGLVETATATIAALRRTTTEAEIIVVDNGTPEELYRNFRGCVMVRYERPLGFAAAVNAGIRLARAQFVAQVNSDVEVYPGWQERLLALFDEGERIGVVFPDCLPSGEQLINRTYADREAVARSLERDTWNSDPFGAMWVVRRKVFEEVGLLDEGYLVGFYEDVDLWKRAGQAGWQLRKTQQVWVYHLGNATIGGVPGMHEAAARNKERYEARWGA